MARLGPVVVAVVTFAACLLLFPVESDAALASDGVWYGIELAANPATAVRGNHPLFHLVAWPVASAARAAGLTHPTHVALRIVSAGGAAALVGLVALLGGRRAAGFGLLCAVYLCATRMFVIEGATGENVLPAAASALGVVLAVLRPTRRPATIGALLTLALALRQDNAFLLPGVAYALVKRFGWRRAIAVLAAVAAATAAIYVAAWQIAAPGSGLLKYVLGLGAEGKWRPQVPDGSHPAILEASSITIAFVGRLWPETEHYPLVGIGALLLPIAAAFSRTSMRRMTFEVGLFAVPMALRLLFYGWFEPTNSEWQIFGIAFACGLAARLARLGPRPRRNFRAWFLGAAAIVVAALHGPHTLALRGTEFRDAARAALAVAPPRAVVLVEGFAAPAMLRLIGVDIQIVVGSPSQVLDQVGAAARASSDRAVLVITDRFVLDSMPHSITHRAEHRPELDRYQETPRMKLLQKAGLTYAMLLLPE